VLQSAGLCACPKTAAADLPIGHVGVVHTSNSEAVNVSDEVCVG
jgi:hypothetical protein